MAGVYRVTEKELRFLLMFTENHGLHGFGEMTVIETEAEAKECVDILCEKRYLKLNQQKEYEVDSTLELLLTVAEKPYGYLIMEDLRTTDIISKTAIYFLDDVIGIVEQKDKNYEMLWLPYLPLAIGEIANLHTPFLNRETARISETLMENDMGYVEDYLKTGFTYQWEMWGKQFEDEEKKCSIFVLSNGTEQLMIKETDKKILVSKPDKAAYINSVTEWLAFIHGKAIGKMLQEA